MDRKTVGNAIAQYSIIIVFLALAVVPAYLVYGQYISKMLTDFSEGLNANEIASSTTSTTSTTTTDPAETSLISSGLITPPVAPPILAPGSLGGSLTNPKTSCTGNMCSIDYGSFIFNGIPNNFSEFVEVSGTTAGTDVIMATIDELIDAAEANKIDLPPGALAQIKIIAEKGHLLAAGEREIEDFIKNGDLGSMVSSGITTTDERTRLSLMAEVLGLVESEDFVNALSAFKAIPETSIDPNIKKMVSTLGDQIDLLYQDFDSRTGLAGFATAPDPETYEAIRYDFFESHTVSNLSNLHSTVICGIGNGTETGVTCE